MTTKRPCTCGKSKPRRYKTCSTCFDKMLDREKDAFKGESRKQKMGTLRRWQ